MVQWSHFWESLPELAKKTSPSSVHAHSFSGLINAITFSENRQKTCLSRFFLKRLSAAHLTEKVSIETWNVRGRFQSYYSSAMWEIPPELSSFNYRAFHRARKTEINALAGYYGHYLCCKSSHDKRQSFREDFLSLLQKILWNWGWRYFLVRRHRGWIAW